MDPRPNHGQVTLGMRIVSGELACRRITPTRCNYNAGTRLFSTRFGSIPESDVIAAVNGDGRGLTHYMNSIVMNLRRN